MADFTDDPEFNDFVDELEEQGREAVATAEREDERSQKQAQAKKAEHEEDDVLTRSEYLADKFLASASEEEARLFAIYRRGDEDPRQLKALIELTKTKASEASKVIEKDVEDEVEARADEKAQKQYGVGPIANGGPVPEKTQEEKVRDLMDYSRRTGDFRGMARVLEAAPSSGDVHVE